MEREGDAKKEKKERGENASSKSADQMAVMGKKQLYC